MKTRSIKTMKSVVENEKVTDINLQLLDSFIPPKKLTESLKGDTKSLGYKRKLKLKKSIKFLRKQLVIKTLSLTLKPYYNLLGPCLS